MASNYPSKPKLSAITQVATLKRSGLVADCIFPPVKTVCSFDYIDWSTEQNGLKLINDIISCKSDVKEVDSDPFTLVTKRLQDHALSQSLGECCVMACGDDAAYQSKIEMGKTRQLVNKLLINREKEAIDLATTLASYTDGTASTPALFASGVDGVRFALTKANFNLSSFALLKFFQPIQNRALVKRNVAVMDQATLDGFLSHPDFLGAGCIVDPLTTKEKVAAILGVEKICIADANYNDGAGAAVNMAKLWPAGYVLFTSSYEFVTSQDETLAFGITAYDQGLDQFTWVDPKKGKGAGVTMQKVSHDFTSVVLSFKAATLVVIS